MFWKTKRKLELYELWDIQPLFFVTAGGYFYFQTWTMLLLSYSTGCYSNTLIDADTNVQIQSIVLILRHFYFKIQ